MLNHRLPNGLTIAVQTKTEADFFYDDIFRDRVYLQHGIELPPNACIFDVGANIGMFTLFAHFHAVEPRIFSFEPAPPLFQILQENVRRHDVAARLYNEGISDRTGNATFTFYPRSSGMSSFYGDVDEEKQILQRVIENQDARGVEGMTSVLDHQDDLLDYRFESSTFTCPLRPLSHVIQERGVERVDLLKIDVQKAEHEVLHGISERDWPKIQQVVVEVHDDSGRLDAVASRLQSRGFEVVSEQEPLYEGTDIYNLYARRPDASGSSSSTLSSRLRRRLDQRARRR